MSIAQDLIEWGDQYDEAVTPAGKEILHKAAARIAALEARVAELEAERDAQCDRATIAEANAEAPAPAPEGS